MFGLFSKSKCIKPFNPLPVKEIPTAVIFNRDPSGDDKHALHTLWINVSPHQPVKTYFIQLGEFLDKPIWENVIPVEYHKRIIAELNAKIFKLKQELQAKDDLLDSANEYIRNCNDLGNR